MSDALNDAAGMAATGIGLGILTMGAMVPLVIMKNVAEGSTVKVNANGKKSMKINVPKININLKANLPKATVKKIKLK